jgi:hypothetical protein
MEIFTGDDRVVIAGSKWVTKLPRITFDNIRVPIRDTVRCYKNYGSSAVKQMWLKDSDERTSFRWHLLHGLRANQREEQIAKAHPHIVAATRGFLGGVVNFQPRLRSPEGLGAYERAGCFYAELGPNDTPRLGHIIEDEGNFGYGSDGLLVFVDGGSHGLERLLKEGRNTKIVTALSRLTELYAQMQPQTEA